MNTDHLAGCVSWNTLVEVTAIDNREFINNSKCRSVVYSSSKAKEKSEGEKLGGGRIIMISW